MREDRKSYLILLVLAFVYDILFTFPPVLLHFGINADILYRFFQPVCDQLDARSFHLFGYKLAVCSRCASIYYGVTLGIIVYPFFRSLKNTQIPGVLYAAIPLAALVADFSINYLGVGHNTFLSRSITGGTFGVSLAFFLVPVWIGLLKELKTKRLLQHEE
jgi:uncharacterized membrane protein